MQTNYYRKQNRTFSSQARGARKEEINREITFHHRGWKSVRRPDARWSTAELRTGVLGKTQLVVCLGQGDVIVAPAWPPHAMCRTSPCPETLHLRAIRAQGRVGAKKHTVFFLHCCTKLHPASTILTSPCGTLPMPLCWCKINLGWNTSFSATTYALYSRHSHLLLLLNSFFLLGLKGTILVLASAHLLSPKRSAGC